MDDKWEQLHETILCVLHDLAFGECCLRGDVNENLLRAWYEERKTVVECTLNETTVDCRKDHDYTAGTEERDDD
jgi:hypothetical protein